MYYRSGSFITPSCVLIIWISSFVFFIILKISEFGFGPSLTMTYMSLFFSPNNYTCIIFSKFSTAPQFYGIFNADWSSFVNQLFCLHFCEIWLALLTWLLQITYFKENPKKKNPSTHKGKTLLWDLLLTSQIAYARSSDFAICVPTNQDMNTLF